MEYNEIETIKSLSELYGEPMDLVIKKVKSSLDEYTIQYLALSPFSVISTSSIDCNMDCSPRGDYPGFIQVFDKNTIAIPDRPGNNRLDSLKNIIVNPNIGILVLVPGFSECLRINGTAKIITDQEVLERFEYKGKLSKSVIIVSVKEVYFHCAKAITRSKIWDQEFNVNRNLMPSFGKILMDQIDPLKTEQEVKEVEELIEKRVKTTLY